MLELNQTANQELCKVANWLGANKLSLNVSKTEYIIFKAKNKKIAQNIEIQIDNQIIEQVKKTKFLGLIIDKELSWKHHIKQVTTKISKMSGIMAKARHYLSLRTLTYSNILWASTYSPRLQGVYKIQKKVATIMTLSKYRQESRPLFLPLGLLKIFELNSYQIALFMYSHFH